MGKTDKGLKPGTVLDSGTRRYKIVQVLGAGGFSITYLVQGKIGNINSFFALKEHFVNDKCGRNEQQTMTYSDPVKGEVEASLQDFIAEANRLNGQAVRHPNIVGINEVFRANNTAYYVMEYVDGLNLRLTMSRKRHGEPYTEREMLDIMRPTLDAVRHMHRARITHLDIKPDNILLSRNKVNNTDRPVIIDFGGAKHYDNSGRVTSTINVVMCTPGYSPMEQYTGITRFTPQADIYALAATMYFMLTGHDPEPADRITPEGLRRDLEPFASERTVDAIVRGMSAIRAYRTPSIDEFCSQLGLDEEIPESVGGVQPEEGVAGGQTIPVSGGTTPAAGFTRNITSPSASTSSGHTTASFGSGGNSTPDRRGNLKWIMIAVALVAVVAIGFVIASLTGEDTPPAPVPDTTVTTVEEGAADTTATEAADTMAYAAPKTEAATAAAEPKEEVASAPKEEVAERRTDAVPERMSGRAQSADPLTELKRRADAGDRAAAAELGNYYLSLDGGTASNIRKAVQYARKAGGSEGQAIVDKATKMGYED